MKLEAPPSTVLPNARLRIRIPSARDIRIRPSKVTPIGQGKNPDPGPFFLPFKRNIVRGTKWKWIFKISWGKKDWKRKNWFTLFSMGSFRQPIPYGSENRLFNTGNGLRTFYFFRWECLDRIRIRPNRKTGLGSKPYSKIPDPQSTRN